MAPDSTRAAPAPRASGAASAAMAVALRAVRPLVGILLPPSAKQIAIDPIAMEQTRKASGANDPMEPANAPGTAKMPAPIRMLTRLAVRPHVPTARTNPASRLSSVTGNRL